VHIGQWQKDNKLGRFFKALSKFQHEIDKKKQVEISSVTNTNIYKIKALDLWSNTLYYICRKAFVATLVPVPIKKLSSGCINYSQLLKPT
jgi:hypothetical protein